MAEITLTGNLGNDAELRFSPNGKAILEFSVGDTPRRLNPQTNQWEDAGETTWWRVTEWGDKAESLVDALRKGTKVLVTGTAAVRKYEKKDGGFGFSAEVKPRTIAIVPKTQRNNNAGGFNQAPQQSQAPRQAPAEDPWGAPAGGPQQGWGGAPASNDPPF